MTLIPEHKKKKVLWGAIFGAVTGAALFVALYFAAGANMIFVAMIPVAAAIGASQMYLTRDE